ncbi:hypothetical protein, partial [Microbacterium sp. GbtcB4]|uniref:hypothetical protein n=1 Tax=Microbacterium sp. GbtcB4 TaxID=2824749 RepID=UPI001C2F8D03
DAALFEDHDPRANLRLAVGVWADTEWTETPEGPVQVPTGTPRTFDLGIRRASPSRADTRVNPTLASDEALPGDHRPV